jgi:hypothetical protein
MVYLPRFLFLAVLLLPAGTAMAQDDGPRTIRIKKESNLAKAQFDNTQLRLFAIDRFGNPKENRIVSYNLYVKTKKSTQSFRGVDNSLTPDMVRCLNKQKETVKIFFTDIVALDVGDHPVKLPDLIEVWFPDCNNCEPRKRR